MTLFSLPANPAKSRRHRRREPQGGRAAGLVLIGANLAGLVLIGDVVAHETGAVRGLGPATAVPDQVPAEEQPALSPASATAVPGSGGSGRGWTA